jgi:cyclase
VEAVTVGGASDALVASIVHYGDLTIRELKTHMAGAGVPVRL